jgi:glycosyltransferase involved in cell wall biosynthesis
VNSSSQQRIGIFLYYQGSLKFHPSVVNSARLWIKNGFKVDIFKCFNSDEGLLPTEGMNIVHACLYKSNPFARIASIYQFLKTSYQTVKGKKYAVLIGIDAYGIIIAGIINLSVKAELLYHSLEILTSKFNFIALKQKTFQKKVMYMAHHYIVKLFEKYFHRKAFATIIQDQNRWYTLRSINGIDKASKVFLVPNSPLKDDMDKDEGNDYLRNKYHIAADKKIVLYAGSLGEWTGVDRILENVGTWPEDVVFVIHGRGNPVFIEHLKKIVARNENEVILSLDQLIEEEFNLLVRSANIGIVWYYDSLDPNVYTIGAASGKLFYYLKYGLPVIVNRWPGLVEIVSGNDCGICVDCETDIGAAIKTILDSHHYYSCNAEKCFEKYEFSRHYDKVLQKMPAVCMEMAREATPEMANKK